ncbi:hypothetical protein BKA64DRAFT_647165 [Cadophora sp. MPI-SDFR-AT-0126]|nr:hypothetical protein BKA64DRAFT_647165 [Leotiomycetes sp. MPI-SDFR-AT-0126]
MFGNTRIMKMFQDIFIALYEYSDIDEDEDDAPLPEATLNTTSASKVGLSKTDLPIVPATVSLKIQIGNGSDEMKDVMDMKDVKGVWDLQDVKDEKGEKGVKDVKDVSMDHDKKDKCATGSDHAVPLGPDSGNKNTEVAKANIRRQATQDFETELIRSSIRNTLQKHILRAVRSDLTTTGASMTRSFHRDLIQFHHFPLLPTELRFKIWKMASRQPRILALQIIPKLDASGKPCTWPLSPGEVTARQKYVPSIHPKSRIPTLLRVNRESRKECMKYYEQRYHTGYSFSLSCTDDYSAAYYINPGYDVLLIPGFGDDAEDSAWLFVQIYEPNFPRIAVDLSKFREGSSRPLSSHALSLIRELHGTSVGNGPTRKRVLYPRGLKDVFFVVDSSLSAMKASDRGCSTCFRVAAVDGWTRAQIDLQLELEKLIVDVAEDKPLDLGFGVPPKQIAWEGEEKPSFNFVSLAPLMSCNTVYDVITASPFQVMKLGEVEPALYQKLMDVLGCDIQLPVRANTTGFPQEIGIKGSRARVTLCQEAIQEVLNTLSQIQNKNLANFKWSQGPGSPK